MTRRGKVRKATQGNGRKRQGKGRTRQSGKEQGKTGWGKAERSKASHGMAWQCSPCHALLCLDLLCLDFPLPCLRLVLPCIALQYRIHVLEIFSKISTCYSQYNYYEYLQLSKAKHRKLLLLLSRLALSFLCLFLPCFTLTGLVLTYSVFQIPSS